MVPVFVREIDSYLALDPADRAKPTPLFFIFHLLGEWRERTAYQSLALCPAHEVDAILGDAIASITHRVMAAVFDGDPQPLHEIILDPNAEQFVRSRMCKALSMLVLRGELDRALAGRFLRDAFIELQPKAECYLWHGWQSAIAKLGLSELEILVNGPLTAVSSMQWALKRPGELRHTQDNQFTLFGDTGEELSHRYGFSDDYLADRERRLKQAEAEPAESEPLRKHTPSPFASAVWSASAPFLPIEARVVPSVLVRPFILGRN
jgi:hypothetical protein